MLVVLSIFGYHANMGKTEYFGDQFRQRVRAERERRGWTQSQVASMIERRGVPGAIATTIAKLEAGNRAVRVDELAALADIFGISVDALIGRNSAGSDLVWAISKLTSTAGKAINDVSSIGQRISGEMQDVRHYAQFDSHSVDNLIHTGITTCNMLAAARSSLRELADQFPLGS